MSLLIDLDKGQEFPLDGDNFDVKYNGRVIVKNSVLENIDTLSIAELEFVLTKCKGFIKPVVTSSYFPSVETMKVMLEVVPDFKVRFKTGKMGGSEIAPITPQEFFEGEAIFSEILRGISPEWSDLAKYKYLFNRTGQMMTYDLELLSFRNGASTNERIARNIFTGIAKNIAMCATFAWCYDYLCYRAELESEIISEDDHDYLVITCDGEDYLVDPTFDSTRVKFGMRTKNFCVTREEFQKNRHDLNVTEAADYEISSLSLQEVEDLDRTTGYLEEFGGNYTDEQIYGLANDLEGENNFEKMQCLFERLSSLISCGRPGVHDYIGVFEYVLNASLDYDFVKNVQVRSEDGFEELGQGTIILVSDANFDGEVRKFVLRDGFRDIVEITKGNEKKI